MKHIFTILSVFLVTAVASAQSNEVKWSYTAKKVADKTYEVEITATLNGNWHIYSQNAGAEGPIPTSFTFTKNPLIVLEGKPAEVGKIIKKKEEVWGGVVNYYEKTVKFVQKLKLKGNIKTNLAGKVEYILCDDRKCLPPSEVDFNVNIGG
jgi:DsbC/DsbD-like thiol-disulfide interchange protein